MDCIAIIPARGGSRRIPRKNIRMFHGKPIIAYSIEAALRSKLFSKVYVSTEDQEIAGIAIDHGAVWIIRPNDLADDETGTQKVMQHAALHLRNADLTAKLLCCIYPTAPLMSVRDLIWAYFALKGNHFAQYAFSVGTNPLCDAGQFYFGEAEAFENNKPLIDQYSMMIPIDNNRVCDINTEEDWQRAEQMYAALRESA